MMRRNERPITYFRAFALLLVPELLFCITLSLLFLSYGGHHYAYLLSNEACSAELNIRTSSPRIIMHITDLHVGHQHTSIGKPHLNLERFISDVLPVWAPILDAVVVSGDLVHAIRPRRLYRRFFGAHSQQSAAEWALADTYLRRINRTVPILVAHGNHDSFGGRARHNVALSSFSHVIPKHEPSAHPRVRIHRTNDNQLSIFAIDATLDHPLHRPFNFFGDSTKPSVDLTAALNTDVVAANRIAFGHYPSAITKSGRQFREAGQGRVAAYLSGHLHTMHGLTPRGLEAVASTGTLELETPDMIKNGAFRLVVLDNNQVSTTVSFLSDENPLRDIVVLSPPRAGLCSAGAGKASQLNSQIRVLIPGIDMERVGVVAVVDGVAVGKLERFADCSKSPACPHVYSVDWNASMYQKGTHTLTFSFRNGENGELRSAPYEFSLDGSPPRSIWARFQFLMGALFTLSDFDKIANYLSSAALALTIAFSLPGATRRSGTSIILRIAAAAWLFGAPILVSPHFVYGQFELGWVGLGGAKISSVVSQISVDFPFLFARKVFWPILVPVTYVQMLVVSLGGKMFENYRFRNVLRLFLALHVWRAFGLTREIFGSYGVVAAFLSPCCVSMFFMTLICARRALQTPFQKRAVP